MPYANVRGANINYKVIGNAGPWLALSPGTHSRQTGENLGRILPNAEVHILFPKHYDMDLSPREEWDEKAGEMAALFGDFIKRVAVSAAA